MGFNLQEPSVFISIKLTDIGRRQLSIGKLTFNKAIVSDREVNYDIDRTDKYSILSNRILAPVDYQPTFTNIDGSDAVILGSSEVTSAKQFSTASTATAGFFTGSTDSYSLDPSKMLGYSNNVPFNKITYSTSMPSGGNVLTLDNPSGSYFPQSGDLVFIPWEPIQNSGKTYSADSKIASGNPTVSLWYRVTGTTPSVSIDLDRPIPNFGTTPTSQQVNLYFYPYNGVDSYYGSAATVDTRVWNMNIIRTNSVEGTQLNNSGYTSYGSIEYNGTKNFFGFSGETPAFGVIHYTNQFTGNTYAEQLVEKSVKIDIPYLMWHKIGEDNGTAVRFGASFYDIDGETITDSITNSTFRYLKDGTTSTSNIVGRVYHKLQIIIITDQELLTAMTYKSNRNFTLPQLNLSSAANPKYPLSSGQATGLLENNKTYFVTYIMESNSTYSSGSTYGYAPYLHCSYISKINGQADADGNPQFLVANFPSNPFPYMRNSSNLNSLSGTGWNANSIQLLVAEVDSSLGYQEGSVLSYNWKRVSSVVGNGIYTGDTGDLTIDPLKLAGYQFVVSREDFNSGTTYSLNQNFLTGMSALTFGGESFFFGNVKSDILATTYKTLITVLAKNNQYNTTINPSYDDIEDSDTYITEIGILDTDNNLVAVGKPTNPIRKSDGRYLAFQLEIDF